jgi:threonine dehydratase
MVPSFDEALVRGVASYSLELFRAVPDLDVLYVPVGLGSGICGAIAAREALGMKTEIVGVIAASAAGMALSRSRSAAQSPALCYLRSPKASPCVPRTRTHCS